MKKNQALAAILACSTILVGCGSGLPSCDDDAVEQMLKSILIKRKQAGEGDACIHDHPKYPYVSGEATCPSGTRAVSDMRMTSRDYSVRSETEAADGKSVTCSISTGFNFSSNDGDFKFSGMTHQFLITIYQKTKDGSQPYEYQVD